MVEQSGGCNGDLQCGATGGRVSDDSKNIRETDLNNRKILQLVNFGGSFTALIAVLFGDVLVALSGIGSVSALFTLAILFNLNLAAS